jgi:hypothetical protein
MHEQNEQVIEKKPRLKFIDLARSIAIIMMLEGHFTGAALSTEFRDTSYLLYAIWHNIHGLTSPLFFTVTGLVFVYLLSSNNAIPYLENIRVKKGFKRVLQLLFWGYIIQLNLWSILKSIYYNSAFHLEWFYAFHVLQSIGGGIFLLLVIYGLYKLIGKGKLYWYYFSAGLTVFILYAYLKNYINIESDLVANQLKPNPDYFPKNAPSFIQNMFYGPYSDFSIVRYAGYTIFGGMLGSIIRMHEKQVLKLWFGLLFIFGGIFLSLFTQETLRLVDLLLEQTGILQDSVLELSSTSLIRFGQVVALLGITMLIDKYTTIKSNLFLKIGQNTFPIYVVHVIVLYGGIFGIGLTPMVFNKNLDPILSLGISLAFIFLFALFVKHIEPLERIYFNVLQRLKLKK